MDYGPFGFVEEYSPLWSPFTSDMERKFGFERQPVAAQVNVMTLARALLPLIEQQDDFEVIVEQMQQIVQETYSELVTSKMSEVRRCKLGVGSWDASAKEELWPKLHKLMEDAQVDYTIFFRQLSYVTDAEVKAAADGPEGAAALFGRIEPAFYEPPSQEGWREWLSAYAARLVSDGRAEEVRQKEMRAASPKYVPREWMLVKAYEAAEKSDFSVLNELYKLFREPYAEQPELEAKYYMKTPREFRKKAGVSYFS